MTQEDKELLLKDLCARLPYGVWIKRKLKSFKSDTKSMLNGYDIVAIEQREYDFCKPYLFPLSSMTEEQKKEIEDTLIEMNLKALSDEINSEDIAAYEIDFYNKHCFDYRGLIPKGLAIDATGLNIY